MAKIVCVLYDDPVTGYPKTYARDDLPKIDRYPDGQTLPNNAPGWKSMALGVGRVCPFGYFSSLGRSSRG